MSARKKYHIGIEIEVFLGQQSTSSPSNSAPTSPLRAADVRLHQPMQIIPSKKRTYGLWLLSGGKEMRIDKEDEQPVLVYNTVRPRWEVSSVMYTLPCTAPLFLFLFVSFSFSVLQSYFIIEILFLVRCRNAGLLCFVSPIFK
jgi:hypothetical protein